MSILLACLVSFNGCSADLSQPMAPSDTIGAVAVTVDSSTLLIGHVAQLSITAVDTAGKAVSVSNVSWTSITPDIATVDASGAVKALRSGDAIIEGRVAGSTGRAGLTVVSAADLATNNFNDGTLGPFTNPWGVDLDFPVDPTGSGRGRVARFHYVGTADQNRAMVFRYPRRWAEPMYFKGEFYLPVNDLGADDVIRKLVYWQAHSDYAKYTTNGGLATGRTVVHLAGNELRVDATFNPAAGTGRTSDDVRTVATIATGMKGNTWYTLEVHQQMESGIGRADGVLQIWLNGSLVFSSSSMTWSDPAWVGDRSNSVPFSAADVYFEHFLVGDQVNWHAGSFDEYRYWDNVEFSTRRIGR